MSSRRRTVLVVLAAVLGIAFAAAITWGTSQLARQHIGLASEPLTAGRRLLPAARSGEAQSAGSRTRSAPATQTPGATRSSTTPPRTSSTLPVPSSTTTIPATGSARPGTGGEAAVPGERGSRGDGGDSGGGGDD